MINLLYILIGLISGFTVGMIGLGGDILLIFLLLLCKIPIQSVIATVLFIQLVPQSLPGLLIYNDQNHFRLGMSILIAFGSFIGITYGSQLATQYKLSEKASYSIMTFILILCLGFTIHKSWLGASSPHR